MKKRITRNVMAASALAVALSAGFASCKSGGEKSEDSLQQVEEMVAAVEETPATESEKNEENKYSAAFFTNDSNKSATPTDSTYAQTASGLKYVIVEKGSGKAPKATDVVTVHYTGTLTDGTVFDSSLSRGEPTSFPLNRVIPGWTEGLQLMQEGGTAVFYIPSDLAYGPNGAPPTIPPYAPLIFWVQLISVN